MSRTYRISPDKLAARAARMKALHSDPAFKAKMKALHSDPAFKAATSARMKALNSDPAFNPCARLNEHQRKVYRKLLRCGIERTRAIAEAESAA